MRTPLYTTISEKSSKKFLQKLFWLKWPLNSWSSYSSPKKFYIWLTAPPKSLLQRFERPLRSTVWRRPEHTLARLSQDYRKAKRLKQQYMLGSARFLNTSRPGIEAITYTLKTAWWDWSTAHCLKFSRHTVIRNNLKLQWLRVLSIVCRANKKVSPQIE